jgi:hypothetical protein
LIIVFLKLQSASWSNNSNSLFAASNLNEKDAEAMLKKVNFCNQIINESRNQFLRNSLLKHTFFSTIISLLSGERRPSVINSLGGLCQWNSSGLTLISQDLIMKAGQVSQLTVNCLK